MEISPADVARTDTEDPRTQLAIGGRLLEVRRMLVVAFVAGLVYFMFLQASMSSCRGGVDVDGGFIGANGESVDALPDCVTLTLGPNPFMIFLIAGIVLWAINRVIPATDEQSAARILRRARMAIVSLVVVAVIVSHIWFQLIPIDALHNGGAVFSPFPFGSIDWGTEPQVVL